uniref:Uncharacterized protein n=1 Tax=Vespula pensylvanica TaxID=30213 RepID=A0A834UHC0_VESPE|nr:hypothetical protein H0235_002047 [Vespula pensylvanica]
MQVRYGVRRRSLIRKRARLSNEINGRIRWRWEIGNRTREMGDYSSLGVTVIREESSALDGTGFASKEKSMDRVRTEKERKRVPSVPPVSLVGSLN